MTEGRSVSEVLQDILRNLQEMVRSEIRLAKVEVHDEVRRTIQSGIWIGAGAIGALSAWAFLLLALAYALATRMPMWTAFLVVTALLAVTAALLIRGGIRHARRIQPIPERTVASIAETLEWMKQPTK